MTRQTQEIEALRHRAADYARRASTASDAVVESGYRRLAHHYLKRAQELAHAGGAAGTAEAVSGRAHAGPSDRDAGE